MFWIVMHLVYFEYEIKIIIIIIIIWQQKQIWIQIRKSVLSLLRRKFFLAMNIRPGYI